MCHVTTCCCCIKIRTGVIIIAVLSIFDSIASTIIAIVVPHTDMYKPADWTFHIIAGIVGFMMSICLYVGSLRRDYRFILPWIIFAVASLVLLAVMSTWMGIEQASKYVNYLLILLALKFLICIYCVVVVWSYYIDISGADFREIDV